MLLPILLYINRESHKIAIIVIVVLICGCIVTTFIVTVVYNLDLFTFKSAEYQVLLVYKPYFRLPSFLAGTLVAFLIFRI